MKISIAMATYNGSKYISEQLDSILMQTIDDFELIICDDCSTDNTWEILQRYVTKDSRIQIYRNIHNLGFKRNFEKAISLCKGEYIALSDQDDIWYNNHLELLLQHIGNKAIACGNAQLMNSDTTLMNITLDYQESLDYIPDNDLLKAYSIFFFRNPYQGASMLIKRVFLEKVLPIPNNVKYHDSWFCCVGCFYGGINYFPTPITKYRIHDNNVTNKKGEGRRSKIRAFLRHIKQSNSLSDRIGIIETILERIPELTNKEISFLQNAHRIFLRKKSIWGRIYNSIFELRFYKYIFSCDKKHWF